MPTPPSNDQMTIDDDSGIAFMRTLSRAGPKAVIESGLLSKLENDNVVKFVLAVNTNASVTHCRL
jgi:hypothetical protein